MPTVYGHEDFSARDPGDFYQYDAPLLPVSLEDRCFVRSDYYDVAPQITGGKLVVPTRAIAPDISVRFRFDTPDSTEFDLIVLGTGSFVVSTLLYGSGGISSGPVFGAADVSCLNVMRISFAADVGGVGNAVSETNPSLDASFAISPGGLAYFSTGMIDIIEGTIEAVYFVSPDFEFGPTAPTDPGKFWTDLLKSEEL